MYNRTDNYVTKSLTINLHTVIWTARFFVVAIATIFSAVGLIFLLDHRLKSVIALLKHRIVRIEESVDALGAELLEDGVPLHHLGLGNVEIDVQLVIDRP